MATQASERLAGDVRIFNKYTFMCAVYGLASSFVNNGLCRKPVLSGGHRHLIATAIGGALGYGLARMESKKLAEKEFYIQDYVNRHPEDFKKDAPKKMGEVMQRWAPVR